MDLQKAAGMTPTHPHPAEGGGSGERAELGAERRRRGGAAGPAPPPRPAGRPRLPRGERLPPRRPRAPAPQPPARGEGGRGHEGALGPSEVVLGSAERSFVLWFDISLDSMLQF